ncbi:putative F-box protein At1g53360 [Brassica rapa]|uniref:F-box domain-containing protein n=1 Tax=Brassica campestris TaxID=3711 RepID=M4DAV8_BRACM|nr:putative F-box protein At1g53360 [Brassica rapa]
MLKHEFSRHETSQSSNLIPVDVLIDILTRVPAKSIARFRCVSKFWASSILRRRDFTDLFLTMSLTRPRLFFPIRSDGKLFLYSTHQPHNPDDDDDDDSSLVATPYHTSFPEYFPCDIYSPVCGLVLLQGCERKVRVVCNPATGEFLTLPKVLLKEKTKLITAQKKKEKIARMYLGYDPMSKQFKVLCMTTNFSPFDVRDNTHQVLTLESGKKRVWRTIERKFHFEESYRISGDICINGVLYFAAALGLSSMIVCFDIRSEKFSFINTKKDVEQGHYTYSFTLFNYKGRLGIYHEEDSCYQIGRIVFWVLEDAENHKWSKHIYKLCPLEWNLIRYSMFVGMAGTGEFVWSSSYKDSPNSFYLSFYSLESETFTKVNIQGFDELKQHHRFISTYLDYVENVKWLISDKPLPRAPQNDAASRSKKPKSTQTRLVGKRNSIQKPSPTVLSVKDKNRAWQEKSRGKRIATSSMGTPGGPALSNRFAALDSLEDAG